MAGGDVFRAREATNRQRLCLKEHDRENKVWTNLPLPGRLRHAIMGVAQPPPKSTLTAFAHRIGFEKVVLSVDAIQQACTHPSFVHLHSQQHPDQPLPATNASLATLGNSLLGLFATEFVNSSYPHLPTRVLKAAVSAHVGPMTCANLAREMGVTPILRWHRTVSAPIHVASSASLIHCV